VGGLSIQSCVANDINKILFASEVNNTLMGACQTNKMLDQKKIEKKKNNNKRRTNTFQTANTQTQKSAETSSIDKTKTSSVG